MKLKLSEKISLGFLYFILFLTLFGLVILGITGCASQKTIKSVGSICNAMPWLRVNGSLIVDEHGNFINLRGVNVLSEPHTQEDYARMREWGVKVVRFPVGWHRIEPLPGVFDYAYLEMIDNEIGLAKKYQIYVVLSMCQWYWSPHFTYFGTYSGERGYGMPTWLVNGYSDSVDGVIQAIEDFWVGKAPNGSDPDELNPSMQKRYISMWKYLASRYANESAVAGFDLFNEPFPSDQFGGNMTENETNAYLYPFYSRLIETIRQVDPNHIIIYQPVPAIGKRYFPQLVNDSNVVISPHIYDRKTNYDGNKISLESFLEYVRWAPIEDFGIPIWIGEVGIELFRPNFNIWVGDILAILSEHDFGWAWWVYSKRNSPCYSLLYSNGTEKTEITSIVKAYL